MFLPGIKEVTRWIYKINNIGFPEIAIPSENINSITVHHIDKMNRFFPPFKYNGLVSSWDKVPENLYQKWLNSREPDLVPGKKKVI